MKSMKIKFFLGMIVILVSIFFSNVFAEDINGYNFPTGSNVGIKIEEMPDDTGVKQYFISVALRVKEGQTINQIEGTLQLDPKVFDLEDLSKNLSTNFVKWDIFTNSADIDPNQLKQGLLTYKGSTDVGFTEVSPAEAFGVLVKVRADNQSPTTSVKVQSDSFRLTDTKKDPTVNLFTGEVVNIIENLPLWKVTDSVIQDSAPDVITIEPKSDKPESEIPVIQEDTSKINTGPKENLAFIILSLLLFIGAIYMKKTEKNN